MKSRTPQVMRSSQLNFVFAMRRPQRVQNVVGSRFQLPQCLQVIIGLTLYFLFTSSPGATPHTVFAVQFKRHRHGCLA
jgi:hypothetical protein